MFTAIAQVNASTQVVIGVFDNPPKIFINKEGKPDGVYVDVLNDIQDKEKVHFIYKYDTWNNLYKSLLKGEIDVLPDMAYTKERSKIFSLTKLPVLTSWLEVFERENLNLHYINQLQGLRVGVLKGSNQEQQMRDFVPKNFGIRYQLFSYDSYKKTAEAINSNEIDVLVADRFFRFSPFYSSQIKPTGIILSPSSLHFALNKNKKKYLVSIFDKNLSTLKNDSDSAYYKSLFKWLNENRTSSVPNYIKWIIGIISCILLIAVAFVLLLKNTVTKRTAELLKAKDVAEKSEDQLKLISNNLVNGMIYQVAILDDNTRKFTYLSETVSDLYGCSPEQAKTDPNLIMGKIHTDDIAEITRKEKEAAKTSGVFSAEARVINPDGSFRWSYYISKPRIIDSVQCWDGLEIDISDRKKMEIELQASKEKAIESDQLKSAFLANMSHEIRTPMNSIIGFSNLLKDPNISTKKHNKYITFIEKSSLRMLNIIDDIINISKIETGTMELTLEETNINELIEYYHSQLCTEVENKDIVVTYKNQLPHDDAYIITDQNKLYAVVRNIVTNAIKHTSVGSIEIGYTIEDAMIQFYVKDTGTGIPQNRQEAIFDRFVQADIINKMAVQGAGLGLSISKAYIKMLEGKIWLTSEIDKGTTFYFTIKHSPTQVVNVPIPSQNVPTLKNKITILIVEDDKMSELLLTKLVKQYSLVIFKARNGLEAVEQATNNPEIDLILMDIQMPKMNGHEATKAIRVFNKDVTIIAQTAYALIGDKAKILESGCNECIAKPINKDELDQLIFQYFGN
ncbi:ATP-binding protein [Flavobacterium faecale]|nr:transporter substrate-binding domain-containing protein [Flavobacterium faecale]